MGDSMIPVVTEKIKAMIVEHGGSSEKLVQNVLIVAEMVRYKEELIGLLLPRVEQTFYEVEDVLDEWNHALIKAKIEQRQSGDVVAAPMKKVRSFIPSSWCLCFKEEQPSLSCGIAKKLIDVNEKLEEVLLEEYRSAFVVCQSLISDSPHISWGFPTTNLLDSGVVGGREFDRDILVAKLLCRQEELGIQVVSIVGNGRVGKTTLAQLVYNDSRVEEYFDLRIWICVSDSFDLATISKAILESVRKGSSSNNTRLDEDVKESISGKRYLLVIDDVRERDPRTWRDLISYLKYGEAGSSILVTTRLWDASVRSAMDDGNIPHLGEFTDKECWLLLRVEAISKKIKDVGESIASKCEGSPLVAHYLASLLRSKYSLEDWSNVLFMELQQLKAVEKNLFPYFSSSNRESYSTLKRCFSYCAIFPKDSEIVVEDLIGNWMALGYLGSNASDLELKGRRCFEFLASDSLFQDMERDDLDGKIKTCKIPDIVHDFVQYLRNTGILNEGRLNSTTCGACDPLIISTANEFLSLLFGYFDDSRRNLCDCLTRLRVLSVPRKIGLPLGMENLIHLRWLKVEGNKLSGEDLKIIFQLYNLQTLLLRNCELEVVPSEIGNLIQLRRLDLSYNEDLKELPESMGRLEELRTLNVENCPRLIRLPDEMDRLVNLKHLRHDLTFGVNGLCNLGLLKNLNLLIGTLRLKIRLADEYLEDVVEAARVAKLSAKGDIERLVIEFEDEMKKEEGSSVRRVDLINALESQRELKSLEIWSYNGPNLPAWITPGLSHLQKLRIMNCDYITSLLPLAKLQYLEEIEMFSLYGLKYVEKEFIGAVAFPILKKLTFRRCPNWKKWEDITAEDKESAGMSFAPRLTHLIIKNCTGLTELPHRLLRNMPSMEVLDVSYSEKLEQRYGHIDSSDEKSLLGEARFVINWRR